MNKFHPLLLCNLVFLVSCGSTNVPEEHSYYDKVVEDFGVYQKSEDYTINDSIQAFNNESIKYHGRYYKDYEYNVTWFSYSNSGFEVTFKGTILEADFLVTKADDMKNKPYIAVTIDDDYDPDHARPIQFSSVGEYANNTGKVGSYSLHEHVLLAEGLTDEVHTIRIYKRSECQNSRIALKKISTTGEFKPLQAKQLDLKMEFFGDSVTCGYAVESDDFYENYTTRTENSMKTYANYSANLLNSDVSLISAGGYPVYKSIYSEHCNPSDVPSMFSMAEFEYNTSFDHRWKNANYIPDVVVIALGANDGSYLSKYKKGTEKYNDFLTNYKAKYTAFVDKIYQTYPDTMIVVSDEILDINEEFIKIADDIVNTYTAMNKKMIRAKYNAKKLAKNQVLPGAGHPNAEMQKIAGYELAEIIGKALNISVNTNDFLSQYR